MYRKSHDEVMTQTSNLDEVYLKVLRNSTMFHMSLGSKELFHSNFLHWISIVNWDAFLQIMHEFAGLEKDEVFWWEKEDVWDCHEKPYHPDNNNIEVRREFHNFDLSIYILDSEKEPDESPSQEDDNLGENRGKWIPVLILENKMKSLPYEEQLERYTQKAFDEWRTGEKIKTEARNSQNKELDNKYGITFILLSLMEPTLNKYVYPKEKGVKNPKYTLKLTNEWKHKTYKNLLTSIKKTNWDGKLQLDQDVVKDYCGFVEALYALASNYWTIKPNESYRLRIFPWNIDNNKDARDKRNEIEKYKKLRIHDIHEKLLYDQLLFLLESKLNNEGLSFCRYSKENVQAQKDKDGDKSKRTRLFTNLSYAHGVGIFEVQYILSKEFKTKRKEDKELLKIIIQVQGDRYCHMVVYDNIVKEECINGKKQLSVNLDVLTSAWEDNLKEKQDTLAQYISINKSTPTFPWKTDANWGKYGDNLIYQYVEIPPSATIQAVIDAIVNDIKKIKGWFW